MRSLRRGCTHTWSRLQHRNNEWPDCRTLLFTVEQFDNNRGCTVAVESGQHATTARSHCKELGAPHTRILEVPLARCKAQQWQEAMQAAAGFTGLLMRNRSQLTQMGFGPKVVLALVSCKAVSPSADGEGGSSPPRAPTLFLATRTHRNINTCTSGMLSTAR
jgi:hypothetical protein